MTTKPIDLSISYAVWSGVSTIATACIGIFFKEAATALKMASISLILAGVFGLYATSRMQYTIKLPSEQIPKSQLDSQ